MTMQLYFNSTTPNTIPKDLTEIDEEITIYLKESTSLSNPTIKVGIDKMTEVLESNYCYISRFKRFYYITDKRPTGNVVELDLKCDVLESAKSDILNSTQILSRSEKYRNRYIPDNMLPIHTDTDIDVKLSNIDYFTNNDEKGTYIFNISVDS